MGKIIFNNGDSKLKRDIIPNQQIQHGYQSDRNILKKRSSKYIKLFSSLDTKSLTEVSGWKELMDAVQEEFGTAAIASIPLGIVSKCFLGEPYEVHILDLSGTQIIEHYKTSEPMPPNFEKARALALHNSYMFIEVYTDKLVLIREDGSATII
ncbi:MAG TPA: hypothetical protein PK073_12630 [Ignavibacteriaceae bacterium]|nr:MAG: hypothetical protein BWY38_02748 [Ignavibacteria bacterium ADurb.Bin266]OQY69772.1 MAG: hypothetical protein B6D44_17210 [Ignavibacteriales bacterium UTCHB2]HQF43748.1 hypothetical protein [Ignavibacteriaceae bacterium]HQI42181.1 hypothetical protein [Ignavibacteriaceae bacterium]